ncbi:MAG: 5-formyltetrahydrofolate cyclo-ligase [Pseudomonadota bacterium]
MALAISNKQYLREQALAQRDALVPELRAQASQALAEIASFQVTGKTVSTYHAIGSEIDPASLIDALTEQEAQLALPVLLDKETMVFRRWDRSQSLVPVGFGTLGPDADQPEILPDLIFAPLAAFSSTGQRIGYGKGHYDRALSKMHATGYLPVFVGLAFDEQEVSPFEVEAHDIALDGVLTPTELRIFEHGRARLAPFLRASELE